MVIVRLWWRGNCPSGINTIREQYVLYEEIPNESDLKAEAEYLGQQDFGHSSRGFRYGFENMGMKSKARDKYIVQCLNTKLSAEREIEFMDKQIGLVTKKVKKTKKSVVKKKRTKTP